jgi:hypothetical protein
MTVAREWAIPVALGLLVAGAVWAVDGNDGPGAEGGGSTTAAPEPRPTLLAPFPSSYGVQGTNATFLLVAPEGAAAAEAALNASDGSGSQPQAAIDWTGGNPGRGIEHHLAFYAPPHAGASCSRGVACGPLGDNLTMLPQAVPLPDAEVGPRLGLDGYNATRATIYVFDSRGLLFATNDVPENWTRFPGQPTTMDSAVWYIGAGSAPNGTERVPTFAQPLVQKLRPLMEGLPVGAVVSTQSNAYSNVYGTLFLTLRVDELVHAP